MVKCDNCGTENMEGAFFCCKCGNKFEVIQICPACKLHNIPVNAAFCPECGHSLGRKKESVKSIAVGDVEAWKDTQLLNELARLLLNK